MLDLGEVYERIISDDHSMETVVQVLSDPTTVILPSLPIDDGSITYDRTADFRQHCSMMVIDNDRYKQMGIVLTPQKAGDPLSPYGSLIRPYRRVWSPRYPAGVSVPLGLQRIAEGDPQGDGTISVDAYDLSRVIARNTFTAPYVVPAGTNYIDAMVALAQDRLGALYMAGSIATTTETTPLLTFDAGEDETPWAQLQKMAGAIGMDVYFDRTGAFTVQPPADPTQEDVTWTYRDDAMLLDAKRVLSDDPGYNGVVMTSESTILDTPIRSVLWDANPSSPTYWQGPYGMVPMHASSPYIGTQTQSDDACRKKLVDNLGGTEKVTFDAIPNAAHEEDDVIYLFHERDAIDGIFVLDTFEVGFRNTAPLSGTCRTRRAITGSQVTETA